MVRIGTFGLYLFGSLLVLFRLFNPSGSNLINWVAGFDGAQELKTTVVLVIMAATVVVVISALILIWEHKVLALGVGVVFTFAMMIAATKFNLEWAQARNPESWATIFLMFLAFFWAAASAIYKGDKLGSKTIEDKR
jgi:hypothetical protein